MPQSRGPWDKLQLVSGGIRMASGQAESLSHPGAQAIAPETEALREVLGVPFVRDLSDDCQEAYAR